MVRRSPNKTKAKLIGRVLWERRPSYPGCGTLSWVNFGMLACGKRQYPEVVDRNVRMLSRMIEWKSVSEDLEAVTTLYDGNRAKLKAKWTSKPYAMLLSPHTTPMRCHAVKMHSPPFRNSQASSMCCKKPALYCFWHLLALHKTRDG